MSSSWPVVLAAALSLGMAVATPPSHAAIAREAQKVLDAAVRPDGPGTAVLIARGDDVIFRRARGRASIELGVPLSPDHAFRIASVTKMFTAASILKLSEAGKLSLDDALSLYLPDMPVAGSVTIRQLLNHTAGISDVGKDPPPGSARRDADSTTRVRRSARAHSRSLPEPGEATRTPATSCSAP
jgi:D-alanyl-D-alanine carboxypeptidase